MEAGTDLMATENHGMIALLHLNKDQAWGWTFMENEVDTLLENGSPVDTIDSLGFSPLHYTLRQECHEIIKRLLDAGADPLKLYPEGGKTALHFLLPCMAQQRWPGDRKPFFPLDQRFLDAVNTPTRKAIQQTSVMSPCSRSTTLNTPSRMSTPIPKSSTAC